MFRVLNSNVVNVQPEEEIMRTALGLAIGSLIAFGIHAAHAQQYTPYPIPGGVKVCSAVVPGNWRNDLPVPKAWNQQTCTNWAAAIGASGHNFACLTDSGIHYDFQGGNWDTCGW